MKGHGHGDPIAYEKQPPDYREEEVRRRDNRVSNSAYVPLREKDVDDWMKKEQRRIKRVTRRAADPFYASRPDVVGKRRPFDLTEFVETAVPMTQINESATGDPPTTPFTTQTTNNSGNNGL